MQLDPTFSERDYGTSSFRDFVQKLCNGYPIEMTQTDQGYLVGSTGDDDASGDDSADEAEATVEQEARSADEAMELLRKAVASLQGARPGKPTYVRHMAQALRGVDAEFDEQRFGFRTLTELMHHGEREGIVKMIRDRQGAWRVTPASGSFDGEGTAETPATTSAETTSAGSDPGAAEDEIVAAAVAELGAETAGEEEPAAEEKASPTAKKAATRKKSAAKKKTAAKTKSTKKKTAAKKKTTRAKAEAAPE